jgi:hypothetical protein
MDSDGNSKKSDPETAWRLIVFRYAIPGGEFRGRGGQKKFAEKFGFGYKAGMPAKTATSFQYGAVAASAGSYRASPWTGFTKAVWMASAVL